MARQGGSGRIPDSRVAEHELYVRFNVSMPPELSERLEKYAADEERAKSWIVQKALDKWLKEKGY